MTWPQILGVGFLGGIGFTISIFITHLAFTGSATVHSSKLCILLTSARAGSVGYLILSRLSVSPSEPEQG